MSEWLVFFENPYDPNTPALSVEASSESEALDEGVDVATEVAGWTGDEWFVEWCLDRTHYRAVERSRMSLGWKAV